MKIRSRANISLIVTFTIACLLIYILIYVGNSDKLDWNWFPQALVTLAALVGASWFAGHRLDLIDKGINERQTSATEQLIESKRTNFNDAVERAVKMMSSDNTSTVLAGQRWLHSLARIGSTEADLVQSLLCSYLTNVTAMENSVSQSDPIVKRWQSALELLFHKSNSKNFDKCTTVPDLSLTDLRGLAFTDLYLRGATFAKSNFTNAEVVGACFDDCDLRETVWSKVGGDTRTSMRKAHLCGAIASVAQFVNVDFTGASLCNNGRRTSFYDCKFEECDFTNSNWTGAKFVRCKFMRCNFGGAHWNGVILDSPSFENCDNLTFELCSQARISDPALRPSSILENLRSKGLLNSSHPNL